MRKVLVVLALGSCLASAPAFGLPTPAQVGGKEYVNFPDTDSFGTLDPLQTVVWDGAGVAWDGHDLSGLGPSESDDIDAMAHFIDGLFDRVVADDVPMVLSFETYGDIYYQTAQVDVTGVWAQAAIDINVTAPPDDLDGLELGGGTPDANIFSLSGDPYVDPDGIPGNGDEYRVAAFRGMGALPLASYITTAELQAAIGTVEEVDLDAMMVKDTLVGDPQGLTFDAGDMILFSVKETQSLGGAFDGGEIWVWTKGSPASFLVHGGETWDTAHQVGLHFGVTTEEVNALEALPEPATLGLLALGGVALLRRRRGYAG